MMSNKYYFNQKRQDTHPIQIINQQINLCSLIDNHLIKSLQLLDNQMKLEQLDQSNKVSKEQKFQSKLIYQFHKESNLDWEVDFNNSFWNISMNDLAPYTYLWPKFITALSYAKGKVRDVILRPSFDTSYDYVYIHTRQLMKLADDQFMDYFLQDKITNRLRNIKINKQTICIHQDNGFLNFYEAKESLKFAKIVITITCSRLYTFYLIHNQDEDLSQLHKIIAHLNLLQEQTASKTKQSKMQSHLNNK